MHLFYNPSLTPSHTQCDFSPEESKHLVKVLRNTEGDVVYLTNGKGYRFKATMIAAHPKRAKAHIIAAEKAIPKGYYLHLMVAPTKSSDRYAWFLEKATEIGVDEITPLICDQSERRTVKQKRMERVLQAAMKQSLQTYLPQLNPAITYREFMTQQTFGLKCIAHCHDGKKTELKSKVITGQDITMLIGPEGDFSEAEIALAQHKNFVSVSLGNNRLRTETAAIVACTTVALMND